MVNQVMDKMVEYYRGDPKRIQHFLKVYTLAHRIASGENVSSEELFIIDIASLVHDIGIRVSEEKYNSSAGKYQELEGPAEAEKLLGALGINEAVIDRVCYIIAHHHTYTAIDSMDLQILIEADFLVNLYEDNVSKTAVLSAGKNIFKTPTGIKYLTNMFDIYL